MESTTLPIYKNIVTITYPPCSRRIWMPGNTGLVMHDRRGREKWQYFFSRVGPKIGVLRQTQNQIFPDPVSGQKPIARPAAIRDMPEASVL